MDEFAAAPRKPIDAQLDSVGFAAAPERHGTLFAVEDFSLEAGKAIRGRARGIVGANFGRAGCGY